jgi:hypothetical protein
MTTALASSKVYIALVMVSGLGVLGYAIVNTNPIYFARLAAFLLVACLAARLKVKLPGITGTMSVNLPFILLAAAEMSLAEALLVGCTSNLVQCLPRGEQKFNGLRVAFNFCVMALAVEATRWLYALPALTGYVSSASLRLGIAALGFFLTNTVLVAIVIALTERSNPWRPWLGMAQLSFPYYVASAGIAGVALTLAMRVGWQVPVIILPVMLGIFYSYRRFFSSAAKLATGGASERMGPAGVRPQEQAVGAGSQSA